ncbi:MAG: thioredoxin family protein [Rhodothermales bacterium]
MKSFFEQQRPHDGLTYDEYLAQWQRKLDAPRQGLDPSARRQRFYIRYNHERAERVRAAYERSEDLAAALAAIEAPQLWMVLTEDWCGDSAYSLPIIARAAEASPLITLRILPRDANLDVMDQYLTGGARSIPKLVAFGEDGEEQFQWGPRPAEAQRLRDQLKAEGASSAEMTQAMLAWYDEGQWQQVDSELAAAIAQAAKQPADG